MGTFDEIRILGDDPRFVCAAGHHISEFQTKDLEVAMNHYYIVDDRLFLRSQATVAEQPLRTDGKLILRSDVETVGSEATASVLAYSHCKACVPVFVDTDITGGFAFDSIRAHHPDVRYEIELHGGRVARVTAERLQTRNDLRQELVTSGHRVLPDDDRVVQKHLEAQRGGRHRARRW